MKDPYVYVIGGVVGCVPTQSCKKFHVVDKIWSEIASIGIWGSLTSPACVNVEDYIYVFDSHSDDQCVHKYSIGYDIWESITYKTREFSIPKSVNSMAFRYSDTQILLLNGLTRNEDLRTNYYVYSLEKEMFTQERTDRKLGESALDRQGNRDYRYLPKVFAQLTEKSIKCFHVNNYYWDELPIHLVKIQKEQFTFGKATGCCGIR